VESGGEGLGATFIVRLPTRTLATKKVLNQAESPRSRQFGKDMPFAWPAEVYGLRVLVVDDQPDTLEMLRTVLAQQCRAEVRTSMDAATAFEVFRQWKPNIVVS